MAARPRKKPASKALELIATWREGGDQVEALAQQTAKALAEGRIEAARAHFGDYRKLLLTHLEHEEDVSFPMAEKRAPSQGGPIKSLRVAHIGIRRDLEQVGTHLDLGHTKAARAVFGAFLESFAAHERLEDQLIELLRKSPSGTGSARRSG
jgi:iron-sulfur cluster repair protein YtfE (RIC family)